jgi:hypothetical protein
VAVTDNEDGTQQEKEGGFLQPTGQVGALTAGSFDEQPEILERCCHGQASVPATA